MSGSEIRGLTAAQALERIEAGELAASEYVSAFDELKDGLNAFLWSREEPASPGAGALAGVPVAVKDIFCTRDIPTTAGSKILEGYRPPYTSTAVVRLEAAGAATLAKTNMDEFAMGSSNENSAYGDVLNPWDHNRVPGGSWAARPPRSPPASHPWRSAPTPAARFASPPRSAGSSASSPRTAPFRATE